MNKICPYCGRKGELGTPCKGCGYVLSVDDKDVPGDQWKSYMDNFWEMPVSPKKFKDNWATNISVQFMNLDITTDSLGGNTVVGEDWKSAENPWASQESPGQRWEKPQRAKERKDRHTRFRFGSFLLGLLGIVLIIYGTLGLTRVYHFFPERGLLDGIVGVSLFGAFALTGFMCIRPLRLRFWKAMRWPIILGFVIAAGIPLVEVILLLVECMK